MMAVNRPIAGFDKPDAIASASDNGSSTNSIPTNTIDPTASHRSDSRNITHCSFAHPGFFRCTSA